MIHFHTVIAEHSESCDALVIGRSVEIFQNFPQAYRVQVGNMKQLSY